MNVRFLLIAAEGMSTSLLMVLGGVAAVVLCWLVWLRHHLARRRITTRFQGFKDRVCQLRERVDAIKERHKLLPANDKQYLQAMTGETLAVYNQIQERVGRLSDEWLRRMDLWEQVETLMRTARFPGVGRLKEANRLLDTLGSFDEVDRACQESVQSLDQLEHGHEEARKALSRAEEEPARLRGRLESVARLPLPTTPYESELAACAALTERARSLLLADPIGAQGTLKKCLDRLAELDVCLNDVVRLFQQAQDARKTLDQIAGVAADRRAHGLLLTEPEGNPDPLLDQGRTRHGSLLNALERGEAKAATALLEQALALAEQAKTTIERQAAAREECAREIPARRAEAQRLQQATATAERQRNELESNFAPESWQAVTDNLARARELMASGDTELEEATSVSVDTVQHYFRACKLLEHVRQQQDQARSGLLEVGRCLQELTELRQECSLRRQEILDLTGNVQGFFTMHQRAIRQTAQARFNVAQDGWRSLGNLMESRRPNWRAVKQQIEETRKGYAAALQEAEEDVRCQQQLAARLSDAGRQADRVGQFFAQHSGLRQQAHERYHAAVATLDRVQQANTGGPADWKLLLGQVEEVAAALTKAEELARQDVQQADRAAAEIDAADREMTRTQGFYQAGISADLNKAEGLVAQARLRLTEQAYEQAIDQAIGAQQAARQAYDVAVRLARQEQQRLEQERQRLSAAAAAQPLSSAGPAVETGISGWPSASDAAGTPRTIEVDQPERPPEEPDAVST